MDADQEQKSTVNIDKLRTNAEACEKNTVAHNAMIWRACSPHEWVWTEEQQAEMARYCLSASVCVDYVLSQLRNKSCWSDEHKDTSVVKRRKDNLLERLIPFENQGRKIFKKSF